MVTNFVLAGTEASVNLHVLRLDTHLVCEVFQVKAVIDASLLPKYFVDSFPEIIRGYSSLRAVSNVTMKSVHLCYFRRVGQHSPVS